MTTTEQTNGQKHLMLQLGARKMNLSPGQFRQCVFIIDELVSTYDCHQFMTPVPSSAVVYHSKIKHPMDLKTLEENLFKNKFRNIKDFAKDLFLIWENAMRFHLSVDPIYQQASTLKKRYDEIILFIQGGKRPLYLSTEIEDVSTMDKTLLPEELYNGKSPNTKTSGKSTLYGIHIFSAEDHCSKRMYGGTNQHVFQLLNSYFFEYMSTDEYTRKKMPLPRLYIAKNRTLLKQAHTDPNGALAIIYNVKLTPIDIKGETFSKIRATVLLAEPVKEVHDVDDSTMDFSESVTYSPKAWIKVKPLQAAMHNVESIINRDIDRNCLKKVFTTFKLSTEYNTDPKKIRNFEVAKYFSHCMLNPISTNPSKLPSEIDPKLLEILTSKSKSKSASTSVQQQTAQQKIPAKQSLASPLAIVTSKYTVTRTKEIPPVPKLRSRVVSNADLEPHTVNYPKSSTSPEPLSYKKLKLTISKGKSSRSSSATGSSDPEKNTGISSPNVYTKSTIILPKVKPSPIVIPVEDHESTSTAAANLITRLNLKPLREKSTKHKTVKNIPYNISSPSSSQSSSGKKLTINPPKDLTHGDALNQFGNKRHKSSKSSPTLSSTKAYTKSRKTNSSLATEIESASIAKERSSSSKQVKHKDDSSLVIKVLPAMVSAPPPSVIAHPSHYVPPLPPHHQLPENVVFGYPAYHAYVYGNPSGFVYPPPNGYPHPNPYAHRMYTPQNSLPSPQPLQVAYRMQPNASSDNVSGNETYTQDIPLPSPSHPSTMVLPPLQLQIPIQQKNLPTQPDPDVFQAREGLPSRPASAPTLTIQRPTMLFRHFKRYKSLQQDHRKLFVILENPVIKQEPLDVPDDISVNSNSTASYEYSDPEDEDDDQENQNVISKYREEDDTMTKYM